mmetsp:Transcript_69240/g.116310  ORF Transcript_69240/g.116310 Transcript_69240/m.116310 type:complete len:94 (+) Transcript_69240:169-450(+)
MIQLYLQEPRAGSQHAYLRTCGRGLTANLNLVTALSAVAMPHPFADLSPAEQQEQLRPADFFPATGPHGMRPASPWSPHTHTWTHNGCINYGT